MLNELRFFTTAYGAVQTTKPGNCVMTPRSLPKGFPKWARVVYECPTCHSFYGYMEDQSPAPICKKLLHHKDRIEVETQRHRGKV